MTGMSALAAETGRLWLAFALAYAAWTKLRGMEAFRGALENLLALTDARRGKALARAVVVGEAASAILLGAGGTLALIGAGLAAFMLLAFTLALAVVLHQGRIVHCNCFGTSQFPVSGLDLLRNGCLIGAAAFCLFQGGAPGAAEAAAYPVIAGLALALCLLTVGLNDIVFITRMSLSLTARTDDG